MLVNDKGRKTGVPEEKTLGARMRINNKLNPHITPSPGIETGRATLMSGKRSHHCAIRACSREVKLHLFH